VIIAAPQALQSSYPTGVIYKCGINAQNACRPFKIENTNLTAEQRSGQWLGGSMDGHGRDYDPLVVCAPKRMTNNGSREQGVCYLSRRSELIEKPKTIERTDSRWLKEKKLWNYFKALFF
jgi:hypothetical protein